MKKRMIFIDITTKRQIIDLKRFNLEGMEIVNFESLISNKRRAFSKMMRYQKGSLKNSKLSDGVKKLFTVGKSKVIHYHERKYLVEALIDYEKGLMKLEVDEITDYKTETMVSEPKYLMVEVSYIE